MQFYTLCFSLLVVLTICYATAASSCKHDDLSQKSDDYGADYRCVWGKQINRYTNKNYYYYYYYYYYVVVVVVVVFCCCCCCCRSGSIGTMLPTAVC